MVYATLQDFAVRLPEGITLGEPQEARAEALLADISVEIDAFTTLDPDNERHMAVARQVCLAVAVRAWINPMQTSQEGIGDYNASQAWKPGVYLLPDEKAKLSRLSGSSLWVLHIGRADRLINDTERDMDAIRDERVRGSGPHAWPSVDG